MKYLLTSCDSVLLTDTFKSMILIMVFHLILREQQNALGLNMMTMSCIGSANIVCYFRKWDWGVHL